MRHAIFSDIHSHTAALQAVLAHAAGQRIDGYFCLGDVGFDDCVQRVRGVGAPAVFGNWEVDGWRHLNHENRHWALALPPVLRQPGFWLTHAAPLWPPEIAGLLDYLANRHAAPMSQLFPYLHQESPALWQTLACLAAAGVPQLFHGHTHRQMVWRFTAGNILEKVAGRFITLAPGDTLVVGVGSVGRPLDGPAPAYAIYDDAARTVEFVRVPPL